MLGIVAKTRSRRAVRWGAAVIAAATLGALGPSTDTSANVRGQALFVEKCGACHGSRKEAGTIHPAQFAGMQWRNWFRREKHRRVRDISASVSTDDARVILDYLVEKAADSDYPETAAIP